ncbi:MAG: DUF2778 domain-containing protein [Allorhizobium sp.]
MAYSIRSIRDGNPRAASASATRRPKRSAALLAAAGGGLFVSLWMVAALTTVHTIGAPGTARTEIGAQTLLTQARPQPLENSVRKQGRSTPLSREELAEQRKQAMAMIARAVAATDDPLLAVLPEAMSLASVDKSERIELARASALLNEGSRAILRQALASAEADRTKTLALAATVEKNRKAMAMAALVPPAASSPARGSTQAVASLASGENLSDTYGLTTAYAAATPAREVVPSAVDPRVPFAEVLADAQQAREDREMLEDVPLPSARPQVAAAVPEKPAESAQKPAPKVMASINREKPLVEEDTGWSLFKSKPKLPGRGIAVYDISAGVVYMPSGEKLEAHSGRGKMRDDPRYVKVKNLGPTPPNIYNLTMRESRFHGVEAIRMLPHDGRNKHGRDGFLTHTYLLRVRGDSSGCVVFKDYNRFLNAFKRGEVKKMIVVPRMAELPSYVAAL